MKGKAALEFLDVIIPYYGSYHDHKETSAWAGTALAITLLLALASSKVCLTYPTGVVCAIAVVVFSGLVAVYMFEQFRLRKRAADLASAAFSLRTELSCQADSDLNNADDWRSPSGGNGEFLSSHVLPRAVLDRATSLGTAGQGARRLLEGVGYALLALATLVAVLRILSPCDHSGCAKHCRHEGKQVSISWQGHPASYPQLRMNWHVLDLRSKGVPAVNPSGG